MYNIVPFKSDFKNAKLLDSLNINLTYISTSLLVVGFVLKNIPALRVTIASFIQIDFVILIIEVVNAILIVAIFVLGLIMDNLYRKAEYLRRIDLVDNSFGTKLSENKSENYYTNDAIEFGFKKIGINNFESAFFTYRILKKSIKKERFKAISISILFFILAICGFDKLLIFILQLSIPFTLVSRLYKTEVLYCRSKSICENYRSIFDKFKELSETKFYAEIIKNIIIYESNLAWSSILLDDTIYNKMNGTLSQEWDNIKKNYDLI